MNKNYLNKLNKFSNLLTLSSVAFFLWTNPIIAQIEADNTLGNENSVVETTGSTKRLRGGSTRGDNLFHSFLEFNISEGETAIFKTPHGIKTIFSRVTGPNFSQILGELNVDGNTNLFFLNPNGIIFGPNAEIGISGSFIASTGSSFIFPEGQEYSAIKPQLPPLLTVNIPVGVQFRQIPGHIVINDNRKQLRLSNGGQTLALLGGEISLNNSILTTPSEGGKIALVSVGNNSNNSNISINETERGLNFGTETVSNLENINLTKNSVIDNTSGDILIQGRNIKFTDGGRIANLAESGTLGNILINASESVELSGISEDKKQSGIFSQLSENATGNDSIININTQELIIKEGAQISSSTFGLGTAGTIEITTKNLLLDGNVKDELNTSGILAQVGENATGNGGNINIKTDNLTATNGGQISSVARSGGEGGNIKVEANQITLDGIAATAKIEPIDGNLSEIRGRSGIFVSAQPEAQKKAGNVEITANDLRVENGAKIASETFGQGNAGETILNVNNLIISNGGLIRAGTFGAGNGGEILINNANSVEVKGSQTILGSNFKSSLSSAATNAGTAGNVTVNTQYLNVENNGEITISSSGTGGAGNLIINSPSIQLNNQGNLRGDNTAGLGNIDITSQNIQMRDYSNITTNSTGAEQGGNITVTTDNLIMRESNISANAKNSKGGRVIVNTEGLFVTPDSKIEATSELGEDFNGVVEINNPDVDPSNALVKLPTTVVDPVSLIAQNACKQSKNSEFTVTGRGGLPPTPNDLLTPTQTEVELVSPTSQVQGETNQTNSQLKTPTEIIPARGFSVNEKGELILVGYDSTQPQNQREKFNPHCQ